MATKVCARCRRSPLGIYAPVRTIGNQRYCVSCAIAVEDGTGEGAHTAPTQDPGPVAPSVAAAVPAVGVHQASAAGRYYCTQCHTHTNKAKMKGSGWIEVVLYLFYILPGVIYSIWRRSGKPNGCPTCGHAALIPAGSGEPTPETHVRCPDCAELVRREARKCKHCGCALVPQ